MANVLISTEQKPITRELAQWLYGLQPVPRERTIKPARLSQLKANFADGVIIPFRWVYTTLNGVDYRANGQHTSYLFQNGTPVPPGAVCVLEHWASQSMDDVIQLWSVYDPQSSSRTKVELTANFQHSRPLLTECRGRTVMLAQGALCIEKFGFGYTNKVSIPQKLDCLRSGEDFVLWADAYMSQPHMLRVGVVYAMLKTYRKDRDAASAFWKEVLEGTNPDPKSGSRQLQFFLLSTNADTGNGARAKGKPKAGWLEIATVGVTCWNYWRDSKPLGRIVKAKDLPEAR